MELLLSASLVAAFIAGVAALFAPCCVTVLLPVYFASIFRERHKVFLMTFIFFLGLLLVFLPIGLGAAALGQLFTRYHNIIFGTGALFLILMGVVLLLGRRFSLPFHVSPSLERHNGFSVFVLGVFSGISTTCCAPVLAGVLALSALPGSTFWGATYTLSYVLGMVTPLFILSVLTDKVDLGQRFGRIFKRPIAYTLGGRRVEIMVSEAISAVTFLAMGTLILYLDLTGRLFVNSASQMSINIFVTQVLDRITGFVKAIPEYIWAALLIAVAALIVIKAINMFSKEKTERQ